MIDQIPPYFDQNKTMSKAHPELKQIIQHRKIPNALLFAGPSGAGKIEAAYGFAMALNCKVEDGTPPCGSCPPCKKIKARMHPDMIHFGVPDAKKNITISQIRDMGSKIVSLPNEANHRMVLIDQAHKMNIQAQNALLKVLEEPPENTFFILVVTDISPLLDTILSRCRLLRFLLPSEKERVEEWVTHHKVPLQDAQIAVGTDSQRAAVFLNKDSEGKEDWTSKRVWIITELIQIFDKKDKNRMMTAMSLAQRLGRDSTSVMDALAVIRSVFRDLCIFPHAPEKIVNLDFFNAFKDISSTVDPDQLMEWTDHLYETEKRLMSNSSVRLTLDRFFIRIAFGPGI